MVASVGSRCASWGKSGFLGAIREGTPDDGPFAEIDDGLGDGRGVIADALQPPRQVQKLQPAVNLSGMLGQACLALLAQGLVLLVDRCIAGNDGPGQLGVACFKGLVA